MRTSTKLRRMMPESRRQENLRRIVRTGRRNRGQDLMILSETLLSQGHAEEAGRLARKGKTALELASATSADWVQKSYAQWIGRCNRVIAATETLGQFQGWGPRSVIVDAFS